MIFYDIQQALYDHFDGEPNINHISFGFSSHKLDLDKTTIFPIAHYNFPSIETEGSTSIVACEILFVDIADKGYKRENSFSGYDNYHDILAEQYRNVIRLKGAIENGLLGDSYQIVNISPAQQIYEQGANLHIGWRVEFNIAAPADAFNCEYPTEKAEVRYFARPSAPEGTYGREDGSDRDNAHNGLTGIPWDDFDTLVVMGVHNETLVISSNKANIVGNDPSEAGVIDVAGAQNRCITNTGFSDLTLTGLQLLNATVDCLFLEDASNVVTNDCTFNGSGNQGIQHFGTTTATHNNPTCDSNADDGVSGHDNATIVINGGSFTNNDQAINLVNSATVEINGSPTFSGNTSYDVWVTNADTPESCSATINGGAFAGKASATNGAKLTLNGGVYTDVDVEDTGEKSFLSASDCVISSLSLSGSDTELTRCRVLGVGNDNADTSTSLKGCYIEPSGEWRISGALDATQTWFVGDGANHILFLEATATLGVDYCAFTGAGSAKFAVTCNSSANITKLNNSVVYGDTLNRGFNLVDGLTIQNIIVENTERAFFAGSGVSYTADNCVVFNAGSNDSGPGDVTNINEITSDPMLVDPDNGNFSLGIGSSAIGTGKTLVNDAAIASVDWGGASTPPSITEGQQGASWNVGMTV